MDIDIFTIVLSIALAVYGWLTLLFLCKYGDKKESNNEWKSSDEIIKPATIFDAKIQFVMTLTSTIGLGAAIIFIALEAYFVTVIELDISYIYLSSAIFLSISATCLFFFFLALAAQLLKR